ncbi:heavy-metal-associated domain-containing protein [Flavobacterium sp.]|uniref:heavy-metal-associated domain-containing protein n=1 Tax=Flavobacterium sp. TaxID=239 RepID=UPI00261004A3|nr:heavy-metal-associated domain-containing protein [Flavobacterium sp.]
MRTIYHINGLTCTSCKATVESTLSVLPDMQHVLVDMAEGKLVVDAAVRYSAEALNEALPGKYTVTAYHEVEEPAPVKQKVIETEAEVSKLKQLFPLFLIFGFLLLGTVLGSVPEFEPKRMMLLFMGVFYLVFSFFKLLDVSGFAQSFAMYDPIAAKSQSYARAYPFLELLLGILFLLEMAIVPAIIVSLITLIPTTLGVTRTLLHKQKIRCACLGTVLKLPMTEATFIENSIMIVLGVAMLFG